MKKVIILIQVAVLLASCGTTKTLGEQYALMYEEKPLTIVVMPPINQTTHAEAFIPRCMRRFVKKDIMYILRI